MMKHISADYNMQITDIQTYNVQKGTFTVQHMYSYPQKLYIA